MTTPVTHTTVDGYTIDLSGGMTSTNNALVYNGTKFVPGNDLSTIYWDPIIECGGVCPIGAGPEPMGVEFVITSYSATITGCKFVFPENVSRTIRFRVWNNAGTAQVIGNASATYYDQIYSVAGTYTVTFPVGVTTGTPPTIWRMSMWETSGTKYYEAAAVAIRPPHNTFCQSGPSFGWTYACLYGSGGDNIPNVSDTASFITPLTPIFTIP